MKGLTLIEVLIYMAILAVFISGIFVLFNRALDSAELLRLRAETAANAEFVMRKIEWAASGAKTINIPTANNSSSQLSMDKFVAGSNPLIFVLNGEKITLAKGGGAPIDLTNDKVRITQFLVEHFSSIDNPSTLKVALTVENKPSGRFNQIASTTAQMFFAIK